MAAGAVYGNEWSKRGWNENDRVKVNLVTENLLCRKTKGDRR